MLLIKYFRLKRFDFYSSTSAAKDAAQTTIPYIDSQEVKPSSGIWLTGIGLYHKGRIGYGGFVGILVKTLDFSGHLLPEIQEKSANARLIMKEEMQYDFSVHQQL